MLYSNFLDSPVEESFSEKVLCLAAAGGEEAVLRRDWISNSLLCNICSFNSKIFHLQKPTSFILHLWQVLVNKCLFFLLFLWLDHSYLLLFLACGEDN